MMEHSLNQFFVKEITMKRTLFVRAAFSCISLACLVSNLISMESTSQQSVEVAMRQPVAERTTCAFCQEECNDGEEHLALELLQAAPS
jgi:hypothetical protein